MKGLPSEVGHIVQPVGRECGKHPSGGRRSHDRGEREPCRCFRLKPLEET